MITGITESGFNFEIEEEAIDDYELFENLCAIDNGDISKSTIVADGDLGKEQLKRLKEHCRNENGRISTTKMIDEITQIMLNCKTGKNS